MLKERRRDRGATIIEVLLAVALSAVLIGALALLYTFTMSRSGHVVGNYVSLGQGERLSRELAQIIRNANSCTLVTWGSKSGLKCIMPVRGTDRDQDGVFDSYTLDNVNRRGMEKFGQGKRVWIYLSDKEGNFTSDGNVICRAQRSDDGLPTSDDVDQRWTFYYGTKRPVYDQITNLSFSVDSSQNTVTYRFICSSLAKADRLSETETSDSYRYAVNRIVLWRWFRK